MRKYAIPKFAYIALVAILILLSVGYTYAYFSSYYDKPADLELGQIHIEWWDGLQNPINQGKNSIGIATDKLSSDGYSQIYVQGDDNELYDATLNVWNILTHYDENGDIMYDDNGDIVVTNSTVALYCRVGVSATYTPAGSQTPKNCGLDWIQPAIEIDTEDYVPITENGWFFKQGYYYYGVDESNLTPIEVGEDWGGTVVASHLYLSPTADAEIFGSTVSITLTVDAVQTTHNAHKTVWGLT